MRKFLITILFSCFWAMVILAQQADTNPHQLAIKYPADILVGAQRIMEYLPLIRNKSVAIVANHTSMVGERHLVDTLLSLGIRIQCVFAPEHGFRGTASAGEKIQSSKDLKTGLPVISLYGTHLKPTKKDLTGIDVVLFDIQDVGARFYTYISTLQYVMEACAECKKSLIVLDRPNPNGFYVDGPVLKTPFKSFVGINPIPAVYGLTMGEYAMMLNGEKWLNKKLKCKLTVIKIYNYEHCDLYQLPVAPSPNLPNMTSIYLYPSLCFFEGTRVSVGRGTSAPFQLIGYPEYSGGDTAFVPHSIPAALHPPFQDTTCSGFSLVSTSGTPVMLGRELNIIWLVNMYESYPDKSRFFIAFFDKLAGSSALREQIVAGKSIEEIRSTWQADIERYKFIRKKYLLYADFE